MNATTEPGKVHLGRNIKRIRETLQIKQQTLATSLGSDWSQKKISQLEDKEDIDDGLLAEVAKALNVSVDAIKEYNAESHITNIQNNYEGSNVGASHINTNNYNCTINYAEKWAEAVGKIEKLYERLLQLQKEQVELLRQMVENVK